MKMQAARLNPNRLHYYANMERRCLQSARQPETYASYFFRIIVALCPPKPKELDKAALTSAFLA